MLHRCVSVVSVLCLLFMLHVQAFAQAPVISDLSASPSGLSQTSAPFSGRPFTLTVNGQNFTSASQVRLGALTLTTTFVSAAQLTVTVPASALLAFGAFPVTVFNPGPLTANPSSVTVNISSSTAVGSYQVTIGYNKNLTTIAAGNVTGGNGAGFTGTPTTVNIDNDAGTLTLNHFQTGNVPTGNFTVAQVTFTAVAVGTSNLNLTVNTLTDTAGNDLTVPPAQVSLGASAIAVTRLDQISNAVDFKVVERGDINGNRSVNVGDALVLALSAGGLIKPPVPAIVGDVNLNGSANIGDALVVALFAGRVTNNLASPNITATTPATATRGANIQINGTGFSTTFDNNQVLFPTAGGGVIRVTPLSAPAGLVQTTAMTVPVPNEAVSGPVQVFRLDLGIGGDEYPLAVSGSAVPLALTSVSPNTKILIGSSLRLTGLGFSTSLADNIVTFSAAAGSIPGVVTAAIPATLDVTVPSGAVCGEIKATVGGQTSNSRAVVIPGTTCFVRVMDILGGGASGDILVLEGTGFNTTSPSGNVVKFKDSGGGTVIAPVVQAGGTQLHVRIPATAVTGDVTVTVGAQTSPPIQYVLPGVSDIVQVGTPSPTAAVGSTFNWTIQANDAASAPVAGVVINFAKTAGGGGVSAPSVTTGSDGRASVTVTMGTTVGVNSFEASTAALTKKISLNVTGNPGPVASIIKVSGDTRNGEAGTQLTTPLVVELRDQYSNVVPGGTVTFTATSGGGGVSPAGSQSAGVNGRVSVTATLGPAAGVHVFTATSGVLTVSFTATAALTPTTMALVSGNNQEKAPGTALLQPLKVKVTNVANVPVPGVTVSWAATAGGGSVSSAQTLTNAAGEAQITATLGSPFGTQTFTATAAGLSGSPIVFTATAKLTVSPAFIDVQVSTGTVVLGGYEVTINFDPTKVRVDVANVTGGTGTGYTGTPTTVNVDNVFGTLGLNHFQTNQVNPKGNFTIARIVFTPLATGSINLTLTGVKLFDSLGGDAPGTVTLTLSSSTITIN